MMEAEKVSKKKENNWFDWFIKCLSLFSGMGLLIVGGKYGNRDAVALDLLEEVGFERDSHVAYKVAGALPQGYLKRL